MVNTYMYASRSMGLLFARLKSSNKPEHKLDSRKKPTLYVSQEYARCWQVVFHCSLTLCAMPNVRPFSLHVQEGQDTERKRYMKIC